MAPGEMESIGLMCSCGQGFNLHQACLRNHSGAIRDLKFGRNERFYEHFGVIMFFRKDPPQTEGRRNAHLLITAARPAR